MSYIRRFSFFFVVICCFLLSGSICCGNALYSIGNELDCIDEYLDRDNDLDSRLQCAIKLAPYLLILPVDHPDSVKILSFIETIHANNHTAKLMNITALSALARGNPGKASEIYLNLILTYPEDPDINRYMIGLARSFREAGEFKQAMAQLNSVKESSNTLKFWIELEKARVYRDQNQKDHAVEMYRELMNQSDDPIFLSIVSREINEIRLQKFLEDGGNI